VGTEGEEVMVSVVVVARIDSRRGVFSVGKSSRRIRRFATAGSGTFGIFQAPLKPLVTCAPKGLENIEARV
jgi:hypothetical protein